MCDHAYLRAFVDEAVTTAARNGARLAFLLGAPVRVLMVLIGCREGGGVERG
jgi:hypothetical protein